MLLGNAFIYSFPVLLYFPFVAQSNPEDISICMFDFSF